MNRATIDILTHAYCESADDAWELMRAMHGMGYQLEADGDTDLRFTGEVVCIRPCVHLGLVRWLPQTSLLPRSSMHVGLQRGTLTAFPTPLAAAQWWAVEQTNELSELPARPRKQRTAPFPPPAPAGPSPYAQPPKSIPTAQLPPHQAPNPGWSNPPPPAPWTGI